MISDAYLNESYIEWLEALLKRNNELIRLSNEDSFKNISESDDIYLNQIFTLFRHLLTYARIHHVSADMFEDEINSVYKDTFMCFDRSLLLDHNGTFINLIILELGGASDMIIRLIDDTSNIPNENIIDVSDFFSWLHYYEFGTFNCRECSYLNIINVNYKVSGIDYKCSHYNELCYKEHGPLAKDESKIHPCPSCRKDNHTIYTSTSSTCI